MKVILTEYVYKHGVAGEVVNVADGFARNWLIPRKLAIPATKRNLERLTELRDRATKNRAELSERINEAASKINGIELVFGAKAGSNNKLYGSITSQMIKDAIMEKTGVDINRRRISDRAISWMDAPGWIGFMRLRSWRREPSRARRCMEQAGCPPPVRGEIRGFHMNAPREVSPVRQG